MDEWRYFSDEMPKTNEYIKIDMDDNIIFAEMVDELEYLNNSIKHGDTEANNVDDFYEMRRAILERKAPRYSFNIYANEYFDEVYISRYYVEEEFKNARWAYTNPSEDEW